MSRAVQGIGAAFMMPATLSIITNAFPAHERGKAIGTWAGVSALALAIGPVVGGFLTEHVSWRAIFFLNLPVAAAAVIVTLAATQRVARPRPCRAPSTTPASATLTVGIGALVLALVEGNGWGWGSPRILALLAVSVVGLVAFVVVERRARYPMVEFAFFRSRTFAGHERRSPSCVSFAMLAMFFFMALYMQNILGYSPLEAGHPLPALDGRDHRRRADRRAGSPTASARSSRSRSGLSLVAIALFLQSRITVDTGYSRPPPHLLADGPRDRARDVADVDRRDERGRRRPRPALASGILSMSRMVGGTFGVAAVGALFQHLSDNRLRRAARRPPAELAAAGLVRRQPRLRRRRAQLKQLDPHDRRTRSSDALKETSCTPSRSSLKLSTAVAAPGVADRADVTLQRRSRAQRRAPAPARPVARPD